MTRKLSRTSTLTLQFWFGLNLVANIATFSAISSIRGIGGRKRRLKSWFPSYVTGKVFFYYVTALKSLCNSGCFVKCFYMEASSYYEVNSVLCRPTMARKLRQNPLSLNPCLELQVKFKPHSRMMRPPSTPLPSPSK